MAILTLNPNISHRTTVVVILITMAAIGAVEIKALRGKIPVVNSPQKLNAAECFRCHTDEKTITRMRDKEDGANYLFNKDGIFKPASWERPSATAVVRQPINPR